MFRGIQFWLAAALCGCGPYDTSDPSGQGATESVNVDQRILHDFEPGMAAAPREEIARRLRAGPITLPSTAGAVQNEIEIFHPDGRYERSSDGFSVIGTYTVIHGAYCTNVATQKRCINVFRDRKMRLYRRFPESNKLLFRID